MPPADPNPTTSENAPGSADATDALVARLLNGEPLAADRLLLSLSPRLLARIHRRLPLDLRALCSPEDILQEVFAEAFHGIAAFRTAGNASPGEAFFRWVARIADNQVIDAVRMHRAVKRGGRAVIETGAARGANQTTVAPLLDALAANIASPSHVARGHEAEAALAIALQSLYPAYREALELRYLLGLSPAEVAARLGRTEEAVHKLCSRALGALREAMGDPARFVSRSE